MPSRSRYWVGIRRSSSSQSEIMHVGASGILGSLSRRFILSSASTGSCRTSRPASRRLLGLVLLLNFLSSLDPGVSLFGHAGGAFVGGLLTVNGSACPRPISRVVGGGNATAQKVYRWLAGVCLVATVAALGIAWIKNRPWRVGPGDPRQVNFAPLPVSMELPDEAGTPKQRGRRVVLGSVGDPLDISVRMDSLSTPIADSSLDAATESLVKRYKEPARRRRSAGRSRRQSCASLTGPPSS